MKSKIKKVNNNESAPFDFGKKEVVYISPQKSWESEDVSMQDFNFQKPNYLSNAQLIASCFRQTKEKIVHNQPPQHMTNGQKRIELKNFYNEVRSFILYY